MKIEKIYNEISEFMNTLLTDDLKSFIRYNYSLGVYFDKDKDTIYSFRVPGATRGYVEVDENKVIKSFHTFEDRLINGDLGVFTVSGKELCSILESKFKGKVFKENKE